MIAQPAAPARVTPWLCGTCSAGLMEILQRGGLRVYVEPTTDSIDPWSRPRPFVAARNIAVSHAYATLEGYSSGCPCCLVSEAKSAAYAVAMLQHAADHEIHRERAI